MAFLYDCIKNKDIAVLLYPQVVRQYITILIVGFCCWYYFGYHCIKQDIAHIRGQLDEIKPCIVDNSIPHNITIPTIASLYTAIQDYFLADDCFLERYNYTDEIIDLYCLRKIHVTCVMPYEQVLKVIKLTDSIATAIISIVSIKPAVNHNQGVSLVIEIILIGSLDK